MQEFKIIMVPHLFLSLIVDIVIKVIADSMFLNMVRNIKCGYSFSKLE